MKTKPIIAFTGRKWSGKSTAAGITKRIIGDSAIRLSFADPIRESVSRMYDEPLESIKEAIRPVLQATGDSLKVLHGEGYLIETLANRWLMADKRYTTLIIDDVRTKPEVDWVHANNGVVIRMSRPQHEDRADKHITEALIEHLEADMGIVNSGSTDHLTNTIFDLISNGSLRDSSC